MAERRIPKLKTERLELKPFIEISAKQILDYSFRNRDRFSGVSPERPKDFYTERYWQEEIEKSRIEFEMRSSLRLALVLRTDPERVIGVVHFSQVARGPFQACYLGYGISHEVEGKGLMSEALQEAIRYLFKEWNLHRIMANHMPENERSGRLLEKLGFVAEGIAKEYLLIDGKWRDHVLTSLTNRDWIDTQRELKPQN